MSFQPLVLGGRGREHGGMNQRITAPAVAAGCLDRSGRPQPRTSQRVTSDTRAWWSAGLAVAAAGWGAQQFAPLLLMYQAELRLPATTVQGMFGLYVLGLIPGLLLGGPVSDRYGRRRVMAPTLVASVAATALLILGGTGVGWLFAGRLVAGVASGAAFSSGAAWIKELLQPAPPMAPGMAHGGSP